METRFEPGDIYVTKDEMGEHQFHLVLKLFEEHRVLLYKTLCLNNGHIVLMNQKLVDYYDKPYYREIHG